MTAFHSFTSFLKMLSLTLLIGAFAALFAVPAHAGGHWRGHGGGHGYGHGGGWDNCDDGGHGRGWGRGGRWRRPQVTHNYNHNYNHNYYPAAPYGYGAPVVVQQPVAVPVFPGYGYHNGYARRPQTDVFFGVNVSQ